MDGWMDGVLWFITNHLCSLSRCRSWSSTPSSLPRAQTGTTLGIHDDPHDANAGTCCLADRPEHHRSRRPRDYLSCWRGREAVGAQLGGDRNRRFGARGRTRGRDRRGNRGGESSAPPVLLAVQGGSQLGVTAGGAQQRWETGRRHLLQMWNIKWMCEANNGRRQKILSHVFFPINQCDFIPFKSCKSCEKIHTRVKFSVQSMFFLFFFFVKRIVICWVSTQSHSISVKVPFVVFVDSYWLQQ